MAPIKARVTEKGDLVVVETELGQKAVVPRDKLCELAIRFNLEYENIKLECEKAVAGEAYIEVE
ncbi:MAG: hypothetical protein F7C34_03140 [Desulfurococcales archaeon]|nr:hypothetical protein [Desulfurococcales archaeon]